MPASALLHLQPSTLNPPPTTLNPQPSTLNTQHSTLNPQSSSLNYPCVLTPGIHLVRFRAKRKPLKGFEGLLRKGQGQDLALTVLYVPYSLDSGAWFCGSRCAHEHSATLLDSGEASNGAIWVFVNLSSGWPCTELSLRCYIPN